MPAYSTPTWAFTLEYVLSESEMFGYLVAMRTTPGTCVAVTVNVSPGATSSALVSRRKEVGYVTSTLPPSRTTAPPMPTSTSLRTVAMNPTS